MVSKKDIICGLIRDDGKTIMCMNFNSREEMVRALGEIQIALMKAIIKSDGEAAMKKGGILNFARRM